ncbi:MAG: response regulator [Candidatus Helarchaeota archaeon]
MPDDKVPPFENIWEPIPTKKYRSGQMKEIKFLSDEFEKVSDWVRGIIEKIDREGTRKKILIVDDDRDILILLKEIIEQQGYDVDVEMGGIEALDKLSREKYDLLLSDIKMPGMDGIELCRECKAHPDLKNIPIILFSAYYDELKSCADSFLPKPIESKVLFKVIKEYL